MGKSTLIPKAATKEAEQSERNTAPSLVGCLAWKMLAKSLNCETIPCLGT